jgi:hypothetical protein
MSLYAHVMTVTSTLIIISIAYYCWKTSVVSVVHLNSRRLKSSLTTMDNQFHILTVT